MKRVAFILSQFPCYDEAFILRELGALSKEMDMFIFSIKQAKDPIVHDEARDLIGITTYTPYFSLKILGTFLKLMVTRPVLFFKAFFEMLFGNIKNPEFLLKNLFLFPQSVYLADWLEKNKIEHMHAYWATYPASSALVAHRLTGIPYSLTGHAHDIYLNTTHLAKKIKYAKFITTCTSQNKDYLIKVAQNGAAGKIHILHHGLDLSRYSFPDREKNRVFEILSVGTLNPHKGFQYLIPALVLLKQNEIPFHATIIGGGPLESELRSQVQVLGLSEQVTLTGPLKQNEVTLHYKKADTFVLMAQGEWHWGIPNVIVEALAAHISVITTRFGSVEEVIQDGKTGLIVASKDSKALFEALIRLYKEEPLRRELAVKGHDVIKRSFDIKQNVREFSEKFLG